MLLFTMISSQSDQHIKREHICKVVANEAVNDAYNHLVLDAPPPALLAAPGQFFHLLCPQVDGLTPFLRRPMSIYRIDRTQNQLHFLYKLVGAGTRAMAHLRPGDSFNVFGPLGRGFWLEPSWQNLLVVARGVGLATLAPLAQLAQQEGRRLFAICSARSPEYLLSVDYFAEMGATVFPVTDSEGTSGVTAVSHLITQLIQQESIDAFFTCGSNRLLKLLQALGKQHNIPGQIALEQQMACGLGMCYCCVRTFVQDGQRVDLRVCKEGPVFDLQEALTW
jgi:dihydroorotate dehydrogenase electron transfer subunit